jgi:hypothetical protein
MTKSWMQTLPVLPVLPVLPMLPLGRLPTGASARQPLVATRWWCWWCLC